MRFHLCNTAVGAGRQSLLTAAVRSFDAPLTDAGVLQAKAASKLVASLRPQVRKPLCRIGYAYLPICADKTAYKTLIGRRGGKGDGGGPPGGRVAGLICKTHLLFVWPRRGVWKAVGIQFDCWCCVVAACYATHAIQLGVAKKEPVLLAHVQLQ